MMIGAIGAIGFHKKNNPFLCTFTNMWTQILSWLIFVLSGFFSEFIPALIRTEFIAILSLFLIMSQIEGKPKFINLENKYFDFIGKISYGIYVIHPLIIFLLSAIWLKLHFQIPEIAQYIIIYFSVPCVTILVAWISYEKFEKPFLKLKNRFTIIKSSNSMNLK